MLAAIGIPSKGADAAAFDTKKRKIHIRLQENGRHRLTIVEGMDDDLDLETITEAWRKEFRCN